MRKKYQSLFFSIVLWGSGQFFVKKERIKGLLLFLSQITLFGIELITGYWLNLFAGQIEHFSIRLYGGFFTKGIWGLFTLGEVQGAAGDNSTILMVKGIIAFIILVGFAVVYVYNLYDSLMPSIYLPDKDVGLKKTSRAKAKRKMFPYLVLSPSLIIIIFVVLMPIVFSILTAFTNYDTKHQPPANLIDWVGFDNFVKLVRVPVWSKTFGVVLIWNVIWALAATLSTFFMGLLQAMMLNSKYVKHKSFFQTIYILPWAIPGMISLLVFRNLLNGQFSPVNQILLNAGLISERIPFLTNPVLAKICIIGVNLWMGFPTFMVMILGVLSNQDVSLYEAAQIDGANRMQVFAHIKLPLLMRAMSPLLVMNLAGNFNNFGAIYFLTSGGPTNPKLQFAGDTDILISWIYKLTLDQRMYSMAAVMNILIFIFIAAVSIWNFSRTNAFQEI